MFLRAPQSTQRLLTQLKLPKNPPNLLTQLTLYLLHANSLSTEHRKQTFHFA